MKTRIEHVKAGAQDLYNKPGKSKEYSKIVISNMCSSVPNKRSATLIYLTKKILTARAHLSKIVCTQTKPNASSSWTTRLSKV